MLDGDTVSIKVSLRRYGTRRVKAPIVESLNPTFVWYAVHFDARQYVWISVLEGLGRAEKKVRELTRHIDLRAVTAE